MVEGAAELMEKKARMEEEKTTKTDRIAELGKRKEEIEAQLELPDVPKRPERRQLSASWLENRQGASEQTDEQKEQLTAELPKITEEIESLEAAIKEGDEELQILEEQIRTLEETPATEPPTEPPPEETAEREPSVTAPKVSPGGEKPAQPAGGPRESIVRIKTNVKAERDKLEGKIKGKEPQKKGEELAKMTSTMHDMEELVQTGYISKTELNIQKLEKKMQKAEESSAADLKRAEEELAELDELLNASGTEVEQRLRDWEKRRAAGEAAGGSNKNVIAAPALVDKGGEDEGKQQPPGPPPPTPDPKAKRVPQQEASEFPLYDSAVLVELREADERAAKAAKAIEAVREQLAVYAKKDEMTDEDIKMMEEKQKELMAKMEEFEEITKKVQHLVGLVDVASSQLGPPQRPMVPTVEGVRTAAPGARNEPEDTLPKVIVCGTGDVDKVPKIIVCEPTKAKDGKQPLYHQIQGSANQSKGDDDSPRPGRGRDEYLPQSQMDSGFPGPGGGMFPGGPMGPGMMGLGPGMMGGPGFMGGPIMMGPGFGGPGGMFGPMGPGGMMEMYSGAIPPGTMLPSGVMMPPCLPCKPKKPKKDKQKDQVCCPGEKELGELLEASLNMTEKLAVENSELEGNRYELQEAVLDKDKQHDALLIQLDSMKQELKTVKNENQFLKNMVAATKTPGDKARGDQGSCLQGLEAGKKTGGLCKKELKTSPICRVQAYKEMGLPMPRMDNKPQCPGAKFAVSMGWNENQGCRNELNKSVNCPDMKGSSNANVNFDRTNPNKCGNMGSGDTGTGHGPNCPCSCCTKLPPCKKEEMDEIVMKMEQEVKCLQNELELVQAERKGLALQKKLLNCMAENSMGNQTQNQQMCQSDSRPDCAPKQPPCNKPLVILRKPQPENLSSVELQLNSLREQYRKLQEDYNCKVEEVSMVRVEYEAAKRDALALLEKCREAEARVDDLLDRLRVIEMEKTKMAGSKDQMLELEQQLTLAKQRYREGQEELEEIKTTMQDQMLQLEEYRNKYLTAQQTVEEQRRQIDIMELENNRISEQVNLEIQRVKNQFQEKLQELTPLPDMLKATQLKLQECDQLRQLAERNVEQLLNQTDEMREQNKKLETELEDLRKHTAANTAENNNLASSLTTGEKKIEEIKSENNKLRATVARLEEVALNNDRRLDEKTHEVLQLQTQLETLREESARQVSRTKDRCEAIRRTLQSQISQLECQLAQSRAAARTAQKDRDEIRQRMQAQITSLNDNFEQAQLRIRSLQSHVNYLKSSYTNIFCPEQNTPCGPKPIDGLSTC